MICEPVDGIKQHEHEEAVRMIGYKTAIYLGKLEQTLNQMK